MNSIKYLVLLLVGVLAASALLGQDITKGSIAGVVRDASGAVIPNVTVRLDSPYGDRQTTTSGNGEYLFSNLVVGSGYAVLVDQPGFAPRKFPG